MQLGRDITAVKRTPRSTSAGGLTQCAHRQDRTSTGPRRRSEMAAAQVLTLRSVDALAIASRFQLPVPFTGGVTRALC